MYLRGLAMGIIYQTGLHLAVAHWFLFLFPTVFTQVCFIEKRATIPQLCSLRITGVLPLWTTQCLSWAWCILQYLCNFPLKNKSRLSSHSCNHISVHSNHAKQWLETTGNFSKDWNLPFTGDFGCQLGKARTRLQPPGQSIYMRLPHLCLHGHAG